MTLLQDAILVAFLSLTAAAAWQWWQRRTRPAAHVTAAFAVIAVVMLIGRLPLAEDGLVGSVASLLSVVLLAGFPWFLAAFAWSFEGPLPGWLRLAGGLALAIGLWGAVLAPFPDPQQRAVQHEVYILVFIAVWGILAVAAAARLWTTGGRQRVVQARMRLMSIGMVAMTVALFVAVGGTGGDGEAIQLATRSLLVVAAVAFGAGFAPPLPLRLWWRRRATEQFQRMQVALIRASTPLEVAEAVVPTLAELLGSSVVLVGPDRQVLAASQVPGEQAQALARRLSAGGTVDDDTLVVPVNTSWLLVRTNPYTPVFGQDEQELVEGFSLHLQLALERAELFESHLEARAQAEQASRELEATLLGLSHDLRSPAIAISGFAALLPVTEDADDRAEMIERIQASTAYLNDLIDALLELSRIGRTQTDVEAVDLTAIARLVAQRLSANHPRVQVEIHEPLPVAMLNPARAEQLLDNLVGNAVKHGGREDLTVTIRARRTTDAVELIVADDGQGIREEDRELVFALFQRGANAGGRGSGLGLGMVRRIAEAHGGAVRLAPSSTGATFVVSLPGEIVVDRSAQQPA